MNRPDPEFEAWVERARGVSVEAAAALVGFVPARGQGKRAERAGPCPRCGGTDRFAINIPRNIWNCRGCGRGGRDGIGLVMHGLGLEFVAACEVVEGPRPVPPAGESEHDRADRLARTQARIDEIRREREAADAERERSANAYREAERLKAYRWWRSARGIFGTPAEAYLRARGLDLPEGGRLRFQPDWTLYDGEEVDARGDKHPIAVHRGPALFAPIVEGEGAAERFAGLHITWFDPARPGEKVFVSGDDGRVPAKKMRGVKAGGHIVLVAPRGPLTRLFVGEGIETVLSVWTALRAARSPLLEGAGFRTSGDLGNLAGRALDRLIHPTATRTDKAGRVYRAKVPGIVPDLTSRAIVIPDGVVDLHLVGDGDSEPFFTRCVLARAAARHARDGRVVRVVMAEPGFDFNDMIRGRHHG